MGKNQKFVQKQIILEKQRVNNLQKETPFRFNSNKEIKYTKKFPDNKSVFYYPLKKNFMSNEEEKKYNHYYGEEFIDRVSRIDRSNKKETYIPDDLISNLIFIYLLISKSSERELIPKIKTVLKIKSCTRMAIIKRIKILYDRYHGYLDEEKSDKQFWYMSCKTHEKKNILTLFQNNKQLYCNIDNIYDCSFHSNIDPNFDNPSSYDQIKYLKSYKKLIEFSLYTLFGNNTNNLINNQESNDMIIEEQSDNEANEEKKEIKNNNMNNNNINIERNNSYQNSSNDEGAENENMENNENINIIDINEEEIKNISLQDEIPNFNNIYKKISEKFKSIQKNNDFKDQFQSLIKTEINKINSNYDVNTPNYIYSTNVIESQLTIYSFFTQKFLEFLQTQNEKDTFDLIKDIHENITKSYLTLIKIIYKLYPIVDEKFQMIKMQLNEAIKHNNNVFVELNENENKIKEDTKNKEKLINNYQERISYLESKVKQLEKENNLMSEKLLSPVKNLMNFSTDKPYQPLQNSSNINNINNILPQKYDFIYNKNYYENINNSFNNNSFLQSSPVCNRVFTIKMMKEIINDIYNSKAEFDKKSDENKLPRETMEQHMYTYLNQKYGLKSIIIEWASNIINGIKIFSSEDSEICLFGKILRNEIEEDARLIYSDVQKSILEYLKYYIKRKNHYISAKEISAILKEKKNGSLTEEEWREVINYLYNEEHAKILEERISDIIQKKYFKSKLDTDRKLTREEIIQLSKLKEEYNIPFKDLVKIIHEFQIKQREKQLKNFVQLFKSVDKDNNGIINEEEFVNLLYNMNIFGDQLKRKIVELLTQIDPYNNKQITFSECVNLFGSIPYEQEGNIQNNQNNQNNKNNQISILDKICMG